MKEKDEKEKIYNPAGNNTDAPARGMASSNSYTAEEIENIDTAEEGLPKNFERTDERGQTDDRGD